MLKSESLKAFFVVGLLFPLHIILGILAVPLLLCYLYMGNYIAWAVAIAYSPFYFYPAQVKYPGWMGFDAMWRWMDYATSCKSYFGEFAVHDAPVDRQKQYFIACHPHGTVKILYAGYTFKIFCLVNFSTTILAKSVVGYVF